MAQRGGIKIIFPVFLAFPYIYKYVKGEDGGNLENCQGQVDPASKIGPEEKGREMIEGEPY